MLIVLFCLDGVTEVARPRPYRRGLRSHLINHQRYTLAFGICSIALLPEYSSNMAVGA